MPLRRDYVAEIEAKRARARAFPVIAPLRLMRLEVAFKTSQDDPELIRYFPLALVAIIEGFVRRAIQELIDGKPECLDSLLSSPFAREQKFDMSILRAVAGRRISVGELVSHLLPVKSVETIDSAMSAVLGSPFLEQLRTVHDRWAVEVEGKVKEPILADLDAVLRSVAGTFRHRHVLAHEPADNHVLPKEEVAEQIRATAALLSAAGELVGETLHPNAPLTQGAMNQAAHEAAHAKEEELAQAFSRMKGSVSGSMAAALERSQATWLSYRDAQAELEGLVVEGGSMQPMMESAAREALTAGRLQDLERIVLDWETPPDSEARAV